VSVNRTQDGSVIDSSGKVLYFSAARFVTDIAEGRCCFVCGVPPESGKVFNEEHVLPDWLLRAMALHSKKISLPNDIRTQYGKYKIPCCQSCNSELNENYEKPISDALSKGHESFCDFVEGQGRELVYCWLALIFFKTHLKDREFIFNVKDRSSLPFSIGDVYDYYDLHHAHCLLRAPLLNARVDQGVIGSLIALPARLGTEPDSEDFDYCDIYMSKTVALRFGETALFAVLDDSRVTTVFLQNHLSRIVAPILPMQLREIHAHIAYLSANLEERPRFGTAVDDDGRVSIVTKFPTAPPRLRANEVAPFREFLQTSAESVLRQRPETEEIRALIAADSWSWLFDENGEQITDVNKRYKAK
jgi:hypothetical protein